MGYPVEKLRLAADIMPLYVGGSFAMGASVLTVLESISAVKVARDDGASNAAGSSGMPRGCRGSAASPAVVSCADGAR